MRRATLLATAAVTCGVLAVPAPASAVDTVVTLPISRLTAFVVDAANERLYLAGDGYLVVGDLAGAGLTRTYLGDAAALALSPDSTRLYVARHDAIAAYDTATMTVAATYPTGDQTCPRSLSAVGTSVWFGYGCTAGGIGLLDLAAEAPVVTLGKAPAEATQLPTAPLVRVTPDGTRMVATSRGASPSYLYSFTVTDGALGANAVRDVGTDLRDVALTPDGTRVVTAAGFPYHHTRLLVSDLTADGSFGAQQPYPAAVAANDAFVATGTDAASDEDVRVYRADGALLREYELGSHVLPGGLAFGNGGTVYVVSGTPYNDPLKLHVFTDATKPLPAMTLNYPVSPKVGTAFTLTGTLVGPPPGTVLHVTRSSQYGTVSMPDVATDAGGSFAVTDTVAKRGGYTYTATFAGDETWAPASRGRAFAVAGLVPALNITTDKLVYPYHANALVSARLTTWSSNRGVSIYAANRDLGSKTLKMGNVDASGYLRVSYAITRRTLLTVRYPGDDVYAPRSVTIARDAQASLNTQLLGSYTTSGGYRLYRRSVDPVVQVVVEPARSGTCMTFEAQRYVSGAWRAVATNTCIRLDQNGWTYAVLTGTPPVSVPYRLRVTFPGDDRNVRTVGGWLYLRFTY